MLKTVVRGVVITGIVGVLAIGGVVLLAPESNRADEVRPLPSVPPPERLALDPQEAAAVGEVSSQTADEPPDSSEGDQYTVLYFYRASRSGAKEKAEEVASLVRTLSQPATCRAVDVEDPARQSLLAKYGVRAEPTTLVLAPNGAVATGFPGPVSAEKLSSGFVSPTMADILKAVQQSKVVFLAVVRPGMPGADDVRRATHEAATQLAGISEAIEMDPRDEREGQLLEASGISPDSAVPETLVISPRGVIVQRFKGAVEPQHLYDSFQRILAQANGCGSSPVTGGSACQPGRGAAGQSTCGQ